MIWYIYIYICIILASYAKRGKISSFIHRGPKKAHTKLSLIVSTLATFCSFNSSNSINALFLQCNWGNSNVRQVHFNVVSWQVFGLLFISSPWYSNFISLSTKLLHGILQENPSQPYFWSVRGNLKWRVLSQLD